MGVAPHFPAAIPPIRLSQSRFGTGVAYRPIAAATGTQSLTIESEIRSLSYPNPVL